MYVPTIPGITTSVIDRSIIQVQNTGKRSVLLPMFSRYGKEGFTYHNSYSEFLYNVGRPDLKKYGKAFLYGQAVTQTDQLITYRLLPGDATYANNTIKASGEFESFSGITLKPQLFQADPEIVLSGMAQDRGDGYNSIFVTFSPAVSFEKADSDLNGETNYKFNFVQAEIFEETPNGVKSLGDPVVFSLMENDPFTNEPIIDKITGKSIFVNEIFKDANQFVTMMINSNFEEEMSQYPTIDSFAGSRGRLIVEDAEVPNKFYEIKIEDYTEIIQDANGKNIRVPATRLTSVITNTIPRFEPVLKYTDNLGTVKGLRISITNSQISFLDVEPDADSLEVYKIDGGSAYYNLMVNQQGEIEYSEAYLLRHSIYKKLMNYSMKLYSGYDGENLYSQGSLNMFGASEDCKENAATLLLNFYNNTESLREVIYPKHDFDYMPDWTGNERVQAAMIDLAEDIGRSLNILSLPLTYNPSIVTEGLVEQDLKVRKENVFQSSYNSALYSGQVNTSHRTDTNARIHMPMSFYALVAHLRIDNGYSITEPVANVIKGTLASNSINLTYAPTSLEIESLRNEQINSVIVEPDGTYIIDQLTMSKKATKLSRINIVKVIHRLRKDLPKRLKDLIQNKATGDVITAARVRTEAELARWIVSPDNARDGIFEEATVVASFNELTYKLRLTITVKPIGTVEMIDIPIIVV